MFARCVPQPGDFFREILQFFGDFENLAKNLTIFFFFKQNGFLLNSNGRPYTKANSVWVYRPTWFVNK